MLLEFKLQNSLHKLLLNALDLLIFVLILNSFLIDFLLLLKDLLIDGLLVFFPFIAELL
jgi:hypothetical protein